MKTTNFGGYYILTTEIEKIPQYLSEIDPVKKLQTITKLLPYVIPTYSEEPIEEREVNGLDFIMQINENLKAKFPNNDKK